MKNATKYADTLKSLFKKLRKEHAAAVPTGGRTPAEPLHALVRGVMSYDVPDSRAEEAMVAINREYVDLNELRVATELEMQDMLGSRYPDIESRVNQITTALNAIFEKESTLSLERLKTIPKKEARQFLRDLPGLSPFTEAFVMTFGLDANCIPLDQNMADFLKENDAVDAEASVEEVQKFCEHNLKSEECFEFYSVLRAATASAEPRRKSRAKA